MSKSLHILTVALALLLILCGTAERASAQRLDVTVTPGSFSYPSADPDTTPVVTATPLSVSIRAAGKRPWTLTLQATDLIFGSETIPAGNVTWTATPPLNATGTLSTMGQVLAQGDGNQNSTSSITFSLRNLWTYKPGTYTQSITFTISSP
jgi:hypothetical protein